ncbi:MAG: gamma-glutamyl phosphate reductase [Methanomassiliicoccales archaeon PtaU1.Bin124]|nr:MAG: gamma-glutamyl phosphate reductase [Methanomassiliicoccales archaeon PtaU1.Bin124]
MEMIREAAIRGREAFLKMQNLTNEVRDRALLEIGKELASRELSIVSANHKDMDQAARSGLAKPLLKRLKYDSEKVKESITMLHSLKDQEAVLGRVLSRTELDDSLVLEKITCPIGVIGVVFESRPEALVQISALCLKSGNAVLLKGGVEAKNTNEALADAITTALARIDARFADSVQLLSTREEFQKLLEQDDLVDLIIPRGSNELVRSIQAKTKIPVMGHAAGICHTYVDDNADLDLAVKVCYDAKVQYPAVCNAMETLLVHQNVAESFLPKMAKMYEGAKVELRGDSATRRIITVNAATEEDWSAEYNDLVLSIKIVSGLDEAIGHINRYGSHHTDAIITNDEAKAAKFQKEVDSSSVMWNCSTRFADGYRYGLGAEVGISTNKTHARGPVGLEGLVIYKYHLKGNGHVVADYVGPNAKKFTHRRLA